MRILKQRKKVMSVVGAAICIVTSMVATGSTVNAAAPATKWGTMTIPKLGITRDIYAGERPDEIINDCSKKRAAVIGGNPGVLQLVAHRTTCGSNGFGGVETLKPGDTVIVTLNNQSPKTYEMFADGEGRYYQALPPPPVGTQLTLGTSKSQYRGDDRSYLKYFRPVGLPKVAGHGYRKVSQGSPVCVAVSGAAKNDWVFVNVTPVAAESAGYATVYPAGNRSIVPDPRRAPATSTVNWPAGSAAPNATLVQAGDRSQVCVAIYGKPVHIIIDALAIGSANRFGAAQKRLIDTRSNGRGVNNSETCFSVPGAANQWAVLNLTAIGRSAGWGRLQQRGNRAEYSNVNFRSGDVDANMVVMKVSGRGELCYYGSGRSDAVVDLIAIGKPGTFVDNAAVPRRALRQPAASASLVQQQLGVASKAWAFVNATPIPAGSGFARLYDCQVHPASGSDVNYANRADPNVAVVQTGANGDVCIAGTGARAGWVLDVLAVANQGVFKTPAARRIYDSRLP